MPSWDLTTALPRPSYASLQAGAAAWGAVYAWFGRWFDLVLRLAANCLWGCQPAV